MNAERLCVRVCACVCVCVWGFVFCFRTGGSPHRSVRGVDGVGGLPVLGVLKLAVDEALVGHPHRHVVDVLRGLEERRGDGERAALTRRLANRWPPEALYNTASHSPVHTHSHPFIDTVTHS